MLTTVECLSLLREYMRKNAAKYGISRMGIFGSVARGEQHEGSDVDICVEIDRPSIFTLVHIKEELEKLNIPIYTNDYFIKKAEIELKKIL